MDDQFTPEEQHLIERLRAAPKVKLSASTREAIRQQMLSEFRTSVVAAQRPATFNRYHLQRLIVWCAAASIIIIVAGLLFLQNRSQSTPNHEATTLVASSDNQVAIAVASPTETLIPTIPITITPAPSVVTEVPSEVPSTETSVPIPSTPPEKIVVVEGPITTVVNNVITIHDFNIEVEAQHPILNLIDVGDVVRIEGTIGSDNQIVASMVSNITSASMVNNTVAATVNLDGLVEAIDGALITVNGIQAQLDADNPVLRTLQVGDFVSVQGDFQANGATVVLLVARITLIDNATLPENNCWYHDTGMGMGHWHCDGMGMGIGMGMGMEAMGMEAPPGMGIEPGMGMGMEMGN